jgi:hypothetical protein
MIRAALTTIARRTIRRETFESLVAPALADLHFDATAGRPLGRHYVGLVLVIATALVRDIRIDLHLTLGARRVWKRTAAWYAGVAAFCIGTMLYAGTPLAESSGGAAVVRRFVVVGFMTPLPFAMIAAAFYMRRDGALPRRTMPIATVSFALLYVALNFTYSVTHSGVAARDLFSARALVGAMPFSIFYLSSYAMFGVVLARGRTWTVPLRGFALIVTYLIIQGVFLELTRWNGTPDHTALRIVGSTFLNAMAWVLGTHAFRFVAPHLRSAVQ